MSVANITCKHSRRSSILHLLQSFLTYIPPYSPILGKAVPFSLSNTESLQVLPHLISPTELGTVCWPTTRQPPKQRLLFGWLPPSQPAHGANTHTHTHTHTMVILYFRQKGMQNMSAIFVGAYLP